MNKNETFDKIVTMHLKMVLKIAFTYTKNTQDAEDIAQEVFLALLKQSKTYSSEEHLKSWLIRVTINKSKNFVKSRWFSKKQELPDDLSYLPDNQSDLLDAILSLDEKYRLPIHLFYYEGYSIREIAHILRTKPATIGTRLKRGREQLKKILGGVDYFAE